LKKRLSRENKKKQQVKVVKKSVRKKWGPELKCGEGEGKGGIKKKKP